MSDVDERASMYAHGEINRLNGELLTAGAPRMLLESPIGQKIICLFEMAIASAFVIGYGAGAEKRGKR
jgi:hypothetical protein